MVYRFLDYHLDADRRELRQGEQLISIEPKVFQVLLYLIENRDRAVSKESLLEMLWPGEFVTEFVLTRSVAQIRQAVGDDGNRQQVIKTIRGYGYRFVATVTMPFAVSTPHTDTPEVSLPPVEAPSPYQAYAVEQQAESTERRLFTMASCELLDPHSLAKQLGPEDLHDLLQDFHVMCREVVRRFSGQMVEYRNDGLVVYFGYPNAYDDAAQRAVHTGLGIVEAVGVFNNRYTPHLGNRLAVRVGIHSGLEDMGAMDRQGLPDLGETPAVTTCLLKVAEPGTVVMSTATYELIEGYFACLDLGIQKLEGIAAPMRVYQVIEGRVVSKTLPSPEAERRHLTVMFCNLVESTSIAEYLDPEDYRDVVRMYQATCSEVIQRYDGHIAQLLGDALLVYFGWPTAHEDDAQRAVLAALEMSSALADANHRLEQLYHIQLAMRIAIHTGLVVVGEMGGGGHQEQLALGATPNVAARLQALAQPGSVVISETTHALVQGYFTTSDMGLQALKGIANPIHIYQVHQESGAQHRFEVARRRGLTTFVGRESELRLLRDRWAEVQQGAGRVVIVSGEAGIGKSRLVQMIKDEIVEDGYPQLECRGSSYYQHTAFHAVNDFLQRTLELTQESTDDEKRRKLERFLSQYHLDPRDHLPIFASLMSIPIPREHYAPLPLTSQRQRQQTLEAILALLLRRSERQPIVLIIEDIQWLDPSTLELLGLLIDQGPIAPIFTLLTCRPTFHLPWSVRAHLTHLMLNALSSNQAQQMLMRLTNGKSLPIDLLQQIVDKTDGVPLFVEEMTRLVLESSFLTEGDDRYSLTGPLPSLVVPTTLQDSLMARLDQLGSAKQIAQLGATLGRQFSHELLLAITSLEVSAMHHDLRQLMEADLLYQRGVGLQATYVFKHALIQEVAYGSLLRSTRQQYHQRIAQILEERFADVVETQPEVLAHHYTEAGLSQPAIECWQRAGQRAAKSSAHVEAIAHFRKGLELLRALPDTPERAQHELVLLIALGASLIMTKGHADLGVERTYARARLLCQLTGDSPQHSRVLFALWGFYLTRAQLDTAWGLGQQLQELAQRTNNPTSMTVAHHALATTALFRGEFILAREHLEQAFRSEGFQTLRQNVATTTIVAKTASYSYAAWTLWMLGYPDVARLRSETALRLSEDLSHPFSQTYALIFGSFLYQFCRDGARVQEQADRATALASEYRFEMWAELGIALRGWAQAVCEHSNDAIRQMQNSQDILRGLGVEVLRGYLLVLLAEAYAQQGELAAGLAALAEAQDWIGDWGGRFFEAELYRMKGELLLAQSSVHRAEAESCFHQALHIARGQQAKSWELRAATSLARLWLSQSRQEEAYNLLAPIYNWFTEGFDTGDLQEAQILIEELCNNCDLAN